MRHRITFLLLIGIFAAAPARASAADSITVSAAISLKESLTQIAKDYQTQSTNPVQLNFGASGQLAAQIAQGAPVDAFISAGTKEMDQLAKQGLIDPATRRNVCGNELVLIVPAAAAFVPDSFAALTDPRIKRIAIGQPKTVPAGQYAQEVFDHLNIADTLTPRLVYGENVRQVLDYVIRGEVDAGIVYSTDATAAARLSLPKSADTIRVAAKADPSLHQPIVYPAAVIKQTNHADLARQFLDYVSGASAGKVLAAHGFLVSTPATSPSP